MPRELAPEPLELRALTSQAAMCRSIAYSMGVASVNTLMVLILALIAQLLFRRFWLTSHRRQCGRPRRGG